MALRTKFTIKKIEKKSWKRGTYVFTIYYVNGRRYHETSTPFRECGIDWVQSLGEFERRAEKEDITENTPSWLDNMLEEDGYQWK